MYLLVFMVFTLTASDSESSVIEMNRVSDGRDICDGMLLYFFKGNGEDIKDHIRPFLEKNLNNSWHRKKLTRLQSIDLDPKTPIDPDIERYIAKKVSAAMEEAFKEEHAVRLRYQQEAQKGMSKNKAVIVTAISSLLTAAITAGVTLAITFGT